MPSFHLGRDMDYIDINILYTLDVVKDSITINLFPEFLKSLVGEFLTPVPHTTYWAIGHLKPPGKPNSMFSWMMVEAPDNDSEERDAESLTLRILNFDFAAVHTSTISFTHALLALVFRPEDIKHLREEVELIYLKETLRFYCNSIMSMLRKTVADYTLGDETLLAYLVLNYDMKLKDGQERPKTIRFAFSCIPNPNLRALFRKRSCTP
ncbi:hypothetical protein ACEPAH_1597 [Sanghuangporus vaninii]